MLSVAAYLDTPETLSTLIISQEDPITACGSLGWQSVADDHARTRL